MFGLFKRKTETKPKALIGIGYWHNIKNPTLPDPGAFVDETWDATERARIVRHLESGIKMPYITLGYSWCRFRCDAHMGSLEFTDGRYVWPEGLAHYIAKHNVRLPREVIDTMLAMKKMTPAQGQIMIDWNWWLSQKGWNTTVTTATDPEDWGILTIVQTNRIQKLKQGDMLRKYILSLYGKKERMEAIDRILEGQQVSIKGKFKDMTVVLAEFKKVGLKGDFQHMTPQEYGNDR